ncbi:MAG: HIRAN domain-containing protein [Bacteroidia bacterium]|nr:HIRAN domain-containing protein [Bacteroidia bacterium]
MKRSEILNKLGLGASGVVLPSGLARVKNEPVRVYDGFLRSIMYYGFVDLKERIGVGDELTMKRDHDNVYDAFAIAIHWKGVKIGYLATYENMVIANLLDSGISMKAYVSKIDLSANPKNALAIAVFTDMVIALPPVSSKFAPKPRVRTQEGIYERA